MQETEEKIEIISRRESRTDPESGFYKRKGKAEGMHYLSHETVDSKNGIIIDVAATAGNVPDSQPYIKRIDYIEKNLEFLYRRGLEAAEQQCLLSLTALNLKRMIKAMAQPIAKLNVPDARRVLPKDFPALILPQRAGDLHIKALSLSKNQI